MAGRPRTARAPISELRIILRRVKPDSAVPCLKASVISAICSGDECAGCRSSEISSSTISFLAHWIAPAPIRNSASPMHRPMIMLFALPDSGPNWRIESRGIAKYATQAPSTSKVARPNMAETCRSTRSAAFGSMSVIRGSCGSRPGSGIGSATSTAPWCSPSSFTAGRFLSSLMSLRSLGLDALGADPDRYAHQQADADEPAPQTLGDRAEPAEAEAARVLLILQCLQVGDD